MRHVAAVFVLVLLGPACAALDLELKTAKLRSGEFAFMTPSSEVLPALPIDPRKATVQTAQTASYLVWADVDDVTETKYGRFRYILYARAKAAPGPVTQFTLAGRPVGAAEDQFAPVEFSVGEAANVEYGVIELPVFAEAASTAANALSYAPFGQPVEVFLASERQIAVPLKNELTQMPLQVLSVRQPAARDPGLWERITVAPFNARTVNRGETAADLLSFTLKPRIGQALATALVPHGKNREDDVITMFVDYSTQGRAPRSMRVDVPVRFVPWPPMLLLVTVVAAMLGWLVPVAVRGRERKGGDRWRALAAAIVVALLVELLGMLLVANDSEFRVLGFEVDPFQMLPAALIGVLAGISGNQSIKFLRKLGGTPFWRMGNAGQGDA